MPVALAGTAAGTLAALGLTRLMATLLFDVKPNDPATFAAVAAALIVTALFAANEAVSFVVNCETQKEVDQYWGKLLGGVKEIECGWLKDKYGLAWQVVPTALER